MRIVASIGGGERILRSRAGLQDALDALTRANAAWMRRMVARGYVVPDILGAQRGTVVYRREPMGRETWQTAPELLRAGAGDCEDLAAYVAAYYAAEGARAAPIRTPSGWHVVVETWRGLLDPSRILGMGAEGL